MTPPTTGNLFLAILLGGISYGLLNTGMATQKYGADVWLLGRAMFRRGENLKKFLLWWLGMLQVMLAMSLLPVAISFSNVSTVAPLSGVGLVVLALFSWLVLGERLGRLEFVGMALVLAGTLWLGSQLVPPRALSIDAGRLWWGVGLSLGGATLACLYSIRRQWRWAGPLFSAVGALMATIALLFSRMFSRDVQSLGGTGALGLFLRNPYLYLYVLTNALAIVPMQIAYQNGRAVVVIPIYSALYMALPLVGAGLLFDETLAWGQILALAVILAGVLLLTASQKENS